MPKQLSPVEVVCEVRKFQYLFQLKQVIRYNEQRSATDSTESVAEHIYGMQVLARYFLPLESKRYSFDEQEISQMILWHDIDEVEVGDMLGYKKTAADLKREEQAEQTVIEKAPDTLGSELQKVLAAYRDQATVEARFVKAIDKFEPLVQLYNEKGKRLIQHNGTTVEESLAIKTPYLEGFPDIKHFCLTLHTVMEEEGYFCG